jgi:hypothetical protein
METIKKLFGNFSKLPLGVKRLIIVLSGIPAFYGIVLGIDHRGDEAYLIPVFMYASYWGAVWVLCWIYEGFKTPSKTDVSLFGLIMKQKEKIAELESAIGYNLVELEKLQAGLDATDEMVSGTNDRITDCFLELENRLKEKS